MSLENLTLIYTKKTPFQTIRLYENEDKKILFTLDTFAQFLEGKDEAIYHETLTRPAVNLNPTAKNILIIGGGDGLVARNIKKLLPQALITLIDIDKDVVELCKTDERITKINEHSLDTCNCIFEDAIEWAPKCKDKYDIIILDLPDPNSEVLEKLYTFSFLQNVRKLVNPKGIISMQCHLRLVEEMSIMLNKLFKHVDRIEYKMPWLGEGEILIGQNG